MVSITWHTKNTPPKQPFWHMYLVVPRVPMGYKKMSLAP